MRATAHLNRNALQEILAAIAAAEVDKLAETKGLDWIDRRKAQEMAKHQAHQLAREKYGEGGNGYEAAQREAGYAPAYEYNFNGGAPYGAPGCPSYGQGGYGGPPGGGYGGPPGDGYGGPPGGGYGGPPRGEYGGGYGGPQGGYGGPPPGGPPHHHGHRFEGPPSERYDGPPPGQGYGGGYEQGPPQGYYNQQGGGQSLDTLIWIYADCSLYSRRLQPRLLSGMLLEGR